MSDLPDYNTRIEKWPFWVGDGVLVTVALIITFFSGDGLSAVAAFAVVFCILGGAVFLIIPYYLEFSTFARLRVREQAQQVPELLRRLDDAIAALRSARDQFDGSQEVGQEKLMATFGGKFEALKTQIDGLGKKVSKNPRL